jgi:hypothetical protein
MFIEALIGKLLRGAMLVTLVIIAIPDRHSQYSPNPFPRGVVTFGAT